MFKNINILKFLDIFDLSFSFYLFILENIALLNIVENFNLSIRPILLKIFF